MSMTHQRADAALNDALRNAATPHILLHTGSPGANGTGNIAQSGGSGIARKPLTFAAPGSHPTNMERRCLSSSAVSWDGTEINAGQNITHFTIWSAATSGQPEFAEGVLEPKVTGSDGVTIESGEVEVAVQVFVKP